MDTRESVNPAKGATLKNVFGIQSLRKRVRKLRIKFKTFRGGEALRIVENLPAFAPGSAGSIKDRAYLTLQACNQTFPFMAQLLSDVRGEKKLLPLIQAEDFCDDSDAKVASENLKKLFCKYGSDKSTSHNYHFVYGKVLKNPSAVTALLEIGLGTNNKDVVSNMGVQGLPGASIRAFRDYLPAAKVYGADVDKRILFEEERIKTFYVDQTNLDTFNDLGRNVCKDFDLIIDDGLHSPNANIAVMLFALNRLKVKGWLVIEDIVPCTAPIWQVIASILPSEAYKSYLIEAKDGHVFAVQKLN